MPMRPSTIQKACKFCQTETTLDHVIRIHLCAVAEDVEVMSKYFVFVSILCRAIVLGYNLPGVEKLVLTRDQIVGIYNGSITMWSDPSFRIHNPNLLLPNEAIVPVARLDSSGTTEVFTHALSTFSEPWNRQYGSFSSTRGWNQTVVKTFGQRTTGLADAVNQSPFRIGYMTPSSAVEVNLPYAVLINKRGLEVEASALAVQEAMDERLANLSDRFTGLLNNGDGPKSYPIAGYSYFIVNINQTIDCRVAIELVRYILWLTTDPQASSEAENQLMVTVSSSVARRIHDKVLSRMTCNGRSLIQLAEKQIYDELESLKTWKVPVMIAGPIVGVLILLLIGYSLKQRLHYMRMLDRDDWKINFFDIEFHMRKGNKESVSNNPQSDAQGGGLQGTSSSMSLPASGLHGTWNVMDITVKTLMLSRFLFIDRKVRHTMMRMREMINHENVAKFYGLTCSGQDNLLVEEYCAKGSLRDFLSDQKYPLTENFR